MKTRKRSKRPSSSNMLKKLHDLVNFECGGCNIFFSSAYLLHDHMRDHVEGGSYYYDNTMHKAFPVASKTEASTQTCPSDLEESAKTCEPTLVNVQSIKYEDDSDTNTDYDDWNDDFEVKAVNERADNTTGTNDTSQHNELKDKGIVRPSIVADNGRKGKARTALKCSTPNVNFHPAVSKFSKQDFQKDVKDVRVSLTRIDDNFRGKTVHDSIKLTNEIGTLTKGLDQSDDDAATGKCRQLRSAKRKNKNGFTESYKKLKLKKGKKKLLRKGKTSTCIKPNVNKKLDENDVSDPDYNPDDEDLLEPQGTLDNDIDNFDDYSDIPEVESDDPLYQTAKIECRTMKCKCCDKFTESMFSKPNLLALHRIPFRQENGRIFVKSNKVLRNEETGKIYAEKSEINFVIDKVAARETFFCDECGGTYKDRNNFARHQKIHKHLMSCPHCDYAPTSRKNLKTHMKIHKQKPATECDICGAVFNYPKNLIVHVRTVHLHLKRYVCIF